MKKSVFFRRLAASLVFLLLAAGLLLLAGQMLRPAGTDYGSGWRSVDVLFLGSSYAYCDFDPVEIEKASGLSGYVMAGSEQTMPLTYWYLRQALRTQSPKTVVLEPTGVFFQKYQNYTQLNITRMPLSPERLAATFTAAEPELRPGLLFDLWFYHERWKDLTPGEMLDALGPAESDPLRGYNPMEGTEEAPVLKRDPRPVTPEQYEENFGWLLRTLELCRERGIRAVVLVNPTYTQCSPEQYARLEADLAEQAPEVQFVNWASEFGSLGLDPARHLYDCGHLNREGAAVYAKAVGGLLAETAE